MRWERRKLGEEEGEEEEEAEGEEKGESLEEKAGARTVKKTNGCKGLKDKAVIASLNSIKTPHLFPISNSSMVPENRERVKGGRQS